MSRVAGASLLLFLVLPVVALVLASSPSEFAEGIRNPLVGPALALSLRTSAASLFLILVTGTPLAWWLARSPSGMRRFVEPLVELPIVVPPAVLGLALLQAFGRNGLLGDVLLVFGWSIPFTTTAVVMAQVAVSAPFFVQSATAAFRSMDEDLVVVARTLGASGRRAFFRVAVPVALPGLARGAALAWARAVGEFGATLLFAGSLAGSTQTMPLAILAALESDIGAARAIALILAAIAVGVLLFLRLVPALWDRKHTAARRHDG